MTHHHHFISGIVLLLAVVLNSAIGTAAAEPLSVPLVVSMDSSEKAPGDIVRLGAWQDNEKFVFAIAWHQVDAVLADAFRMELYLDCDNDPTTGRAGWDVQISVDPAVGTVTHFRHWWIPDANSMTRAETLCPQWRKYGAVQESPVLYPDDTLVRRVGDVFFVAIKKHLFNACPIRSPLPTRVLTTAIPDHKSVWEGKLLSGVTGETFFDAFDFPGFIQIDGALPMPDPALRPLLCGQGVQLWDAGMQKVPSICTPPQMDVSCSAPLRVSAAGNEYESRCLVLRSEKPYRRVTCRLNDAPRGVRMEAFGLADVNDVYHLPRPDRLVPVESVSLRPGSTTSLWLRFHVEPNVVAGDYPCSLGLTLGGPDDATDITVPVMLTIFDFSLPDKPAFQTAFALSWGSVGRYHAVDDTLRKWYSDFFHAHRLGMRILNPPPDYTWDGKTLTIDWRGFDRFADAYLNHPTRPPFQPVLAQLGSHDRMDRLEPYGITDINNPAFERFWSQYTRQLADHAAAAGWLNQITFNVWDEPYSCWESINRAIDIAAQSAPALRPSMIISHIEPALVGKVRQWILGRYRQSDIAAPLLRGETIWTYNPSVYVLTEPAERLRGYYWMLHRDGVTGCLQWSMNHWKAGSGFKQRNVDAQSCWIYPNTDGTAQSSVRVELTREAIEDVDYLTLLAARAAAGSVDAQRLLNEAAGTWKSKDALTLPAMNVTYWQLADLRDRIGGFLSSQYAQH